MKRKLTIGLMTTILMLSVCGTGVLAAGRGQECSFTETTCAFVDEDEDGFCGNADKQLCRDNFVDADCDGVCNFAGAKDGGICYNNCKTDNKTNCAVTDDVCTNRRNECRPQNSHSRTHHNNSGHHGSRRCR